MCFEVTSFQVTADFEPGQGFLSSPGRRIRWLRSELEAVVDAQVQSTEPRTPRRVKDEPVARLFDVLVAPS